MDDAPFVGRLFCVPRYAIDICLPGGEDTKGQPREWVVVERCAAAATPRPHFWTFGIDDRRSSANALRQLSRRCVGRWFYSFVCFTFKYTISFNYNYVKQECSIATHPPDRSCVACVRPTGGGSSL